MLTKEEKKESADPYFRLSGSILSAMMFIAVGLYMYNVTA
jgi:hypothetical protein